MTSLSENTVFHNRYHLKKLVGEGGMSSVWEALDTLSDTNVAVKIFSFSGALDMAARESFVNEFRLMFNLTFPYLFRPTHFDIEPQTQSPYLVSKFYKNGSAVSIINKTDAGLDEKLICSFLHCAASALQFLHSLPEPIIHQDIKPDNFLIDDDGKFILSDFGVSIRKRATQLMVEGNTNNIAGDSGYLAPERFKGTYAKPAQDIFSLGVTLYEILTGVMPFQNFGGKLLSQGHDIPELDTGFGYTSRLNLICQHCMQETPGARPTAGKLLEWAEFYKANNHWPVIAKINNEINTANAKYKQAVSVLGRLISLPLNQIDSQDVEKCISDFHFIKQYSGDIPDLNGHIIKLNTLRNDLAEFEKTEGNFNLKLANGATSINALIDLKNQYQNISFNLSANFIEKKINLIQKKIDELEIIHREEKLNEEQKKQTKKEGKAKDLEQQGDELYQQTKKNVELQIYSNKSIDTCIEKYEASYSIINNASIEIKIKEAKQLKSLILNQRAQRTMLRRKSLRKTLNKGIKVAAVFIVLFTCVWAGLKYLPWKKVTDTVAKVDDPSNVIPPNPPLDTPIISSPTDTVSRNTSKQLSEPELKTNLEKTAGESTIAVNKVTPNQNNENNIKKDEPITFTPPKSQSVSTPPVNTIPADALAKSVSSTVIEPSKKRVAPQIRILDENRTVTLPDKSVSFFANASDEDGSVKGYKWEKTNGGNCGIKGETTEQLLVSDLKEGGYTFRVTVTDNDGMIATKNVSVQVLPADNAGTEIKIKRKRRN